VYLVESDDDAMNQAIAKAKATYPEFVKALSVHDSAAMNGSVKLMFEAARSVEHLWVNKLYFADGKLFGVVNNTPLHEVNLKLGDTVEVDRNTVSDWMYVKNGKLQGGYTIRLLYNKMTAADKADFIREAGFTIE